MGSLSPLSKMGLGATFTNAATASMGNVNLNPDSQKNFLKAAAQKNSQGPEEQKGENNAKILTNKKVKEDKKLR